MHRTLNPLALNVPLVQPLIDAAFRYDHIPSAFPAREIRWSGLG